MGEEHLKNGLLWSVIAALAPLGLVGCGGAMGGDPELASDGTIESTLAEDWLCVGYVLCMWQNPGGSGNVYIHSPGYSPRGCVDLLPGFRAGGGGGVSSVLNKSSYDYFVWDKPCNQLAS